MVTWVGKDLFSKITLSVVCLLEDTVLTTNCPIFIEKFLVSDPKVQVLAVCSLLSRGNYYKLPETKRTGGFSESPGAKSTLVLSVRLACTPGSSLSPLLLTPSQTSLPL